jgi:hypothetical protein
MGRPPSLTPTQQKEATRRRAQGATLQELAHSYDPQHIHHAPRDPSRLTSDGPYFPAPLEGSIAHRIYVEYR